MNGTLRVTQEWIHGQKGMCWYYEIRTANTLIEPAPGKNYKTSKSAREAGMKSAKAHGVKVTEEIVD